MLVVIIKSLQIQSLTWVCDENITTKLTPFRVEHLLSLRKSSDLC